MSDGGYTVDYVTLGDLAQQLVNLRGEFDKGAGALDPLIAAVGHDGLRDKLRDFATNWSDRKDGVTKQLDSVAGFAKAAADVYRQTDEGLRDGFKGQGPSPAPAPSPTGGR